MGCEKTPKGRLRVGVRKGRVLAFVACVLLTVSGCEESVDPIIGTDVRFTLWGFFDAGSDTQRVRVYPVTDAIIPDASQGLDARVFSTDLTTGERREWTYKAVAFDSLITGHIFWSPFRAAHEHRYRLEAMPSDGVTASVEVTVPPPASFRVEARMGNTAFPVVIDGNVPNLVGVMVTYHATNIPPTNIWPPGTIVHPPVQMPVTIPYDELVERDGESWKMEVDLREDYRLVSAIYRLNCLITDPNGSAPDVWLRSMEFSVVVADTTWAPPGGVFDADILSIPETFSNVENGYGFVGAGHVLRHEWTPSIPVRLTAGYNFEPRCDFTATPDRQECRNPPVPCLKDARENADWIRRLWGNRGDDR